jgi:hypothetical protein
MSAAILTPYPRRGRAFNSASPAHHQRIIAGAGMTRKLAYPAHEAHVAERYKASPHVRPSLCGRPLRMPRLGPAAYQGRVAARERLQTNGTACRTAQDRQIDWLEPLAFLRRQIPRQPR